MNRLLIGLCAGVIIYGAVTTNAHAALYGITWNDEVISIDTTTGAGSLIGYLYGAPGGNTSYGLADYNGKLYTYSRGEIKEINPATGRIVAGIELIGMQTNGEGAFSIDSSGTGYLAEGGGGRFWSVNITDGTSSLLGNVGLDGMDFDSSGTLFGKKQYTSALYTINPSAVPFSDGIKLFDSCEGFGDTYPLSGMTFDSNDILYAEINGNLYSYSFSSGSYQYIGDIGFGPFISGLSALNAPVPIPGAVWLLGSGLIGIVGIRRKYKK